MSESRQQHTSTGHHHVYVPAPAPELTEEAVRRIAQPGPQVRLWLWVLGGLTALGLVGLIIRIAGGFAHTAPWGYSAAMLAYLVTTAQSAPLVAVALRLVKADWRRPVTRAAELFTVTGLVGLFLYIPLLIALPPLFDRADPTHDRLNIWMNWTLFGIDASKAYGFIGFMTLLALGLALLYFSALPDFALLRDHGPDKRRGLYARLARGWTGTPRQWEVLRTGLGIVGAFYFMFLIFVHFLVSTDFSLSMVPGWWSAIFPAQRALVGLQSAVAVTLVTLLAFRKLGGLERHIHVDQFWGLSKLLLALTLLWFYFWWSEFITVWYGRTPKEQNILQLFMFGPYRIPFFLAFTLNFVLPFLCLIWNQVRKSVLGPPLVAIPILIGGLFDQMRLYVGPWSLEEHLTHELEHVPAFLPPGLPDLLIIIGSLAGIVFIYLLASRFIPVLSVWEMKEGALLRKVGRLVRLEMAVIAKPR
jgi:hypothetical protein